MDLRKKENRKSSDARLKANKKYLMKTYKRYTTSIKKDYAEVIDNYCRENNLSGNMLFSKAVKYCIENNIDLKDV